MRNNTFNNKLRPLCSPPFFFLLQHRTSCSTKPTNFHAEFFFCQHSCSSIFACHIFFQKINTLLPRQNAIFTNNFFHALLLLFFSLHFASGVLPAGWSVARWGLLAGASCAFVRLPLFAGLVNASGTWLSASARLLGASDYAGIASALLAATGVTLLFECSSDVVSSSHVFADNLDRTAGLVAGHLSILITFACAALWVRE